MPIWVEKASVAGDYEEAAGTRAAPAAPFAAVAAVDRRCDLAQYTKRAIPSVSVRGDIIAYASPDSTYAVTKKLFDAAKKSILIGIYDFTAPHIRQLVLDAMGRGVKVSLMLDIDGRDESELFDALVDMGVLGVSAPSCAHNSVHVFASSHEKVVVIDDEWTLVQSGNYSNNSIPLNETDGGDAPSFRTGNRDSGLAVRNARLAALLTEILTSDMDRASAGRAAVAATAPEETMLLVERAPARRPTRLFPSERFSLDAPLRIQPVLTPDNYLDVVPGLLASATKSIVIEQQYIRATQPSVRVLLDAIAQARMNHPGLKVRIVLGKIFDRDDLPKEHQNLAALERDYDLKAGTNIRYINTDRLVHCHNKMIVIDEAAVLVSSQNWSDFAVTINREAGLWVPHADIARYFQAIFEVDWRTAFKSPEEGFDAMAVTAEALSRGGFLKVEPGDYAEV
jgi:phosphatidylserine/phosphatidylglycerophosphate/cardiolipin synthase-like enzyme